MNATTFYSYVASPLGRLVVRGDGEHLTGLYLPPKNGSRGTDASWRQDDARFAAVREQLVEYFAGARRQFDLPLKPAGTLFQQRVWRELIRIPFGATISYAELARRIGASEGLAGRRRREPLQPDCDHRALPSGNRVQRQADRLR